MIVGKRDTIAALATPAGAGGVGVVRVSGPDAAAIVAGLIGRSAGALADRVLVHGRARDAEGARLDDVLVVVMRAPRSFTGEDVGEVHGHGGAVNMARLLRAVLAAGARAAEPGEFTRRAFENGKLDLVRAEAIADVISASSERAWRVAQAQLSGGLGARVRGLREAATMLLAEVEAGIDFPEEDNDYLSDRDVGGRAAALADGVDGLAASYTAGRVIKHGVDVALVGPVNAGKSSLFNALVGRERALVSAEPGTTRDFVDAQVVWDGLAVTLIDTAGDREPGTELEERGIAIGRKRAADADLVVVVHEAPVTSLPAAGARELHVVSKADQQPGTLPGAIMTSAVTGAGLEALRGAVVAWAGGVLAEADEGAAVTSERQRSLLVQAGEALRRAATGARDRLPTEMVALDVREATTALAEILGEAVGEEVLDALFSRFCIGK